MQEKWSLSCKEKFHHVVQTYACILLRASWAPSNAMEICKNAHLFATRILQVALCYNLRYQVNQVRFIVNDVEYNEESVGLRQKSPGLGMYSSDFDKRV